MTWSWKCCDVGQMMYTIHRPQSKENEHHVIVRDETLCVKDLQQKCETYEHISQRETQEHRKK